MLASTQVSFQFCKEASQKSLLNARRQFSANAARMRALFVLLGFAAVQAAAVRGKEAASENPIRRIVNLLQAMAKEVEADGEKDEEMHEKYMCYCETNTKTLGTSITDLTDKVPQIEASIEEAVATKAQLEADLAKHKEDREAAKKAIADATAQREKEAGEFASESTEDKANIAACSKAVDAIVKGMSGTFLQSDAASALRNLVPQQFGFRQCTGDVQKWKFVAWRCGAVIALPICRLQLFFGVSFGMLYRICGCSTFCEENPKVSRIERS